MNNGRTLMLLKKFSQQIIRIDLSGNELGPIDKFEAHAARCIRNKIYHRAFSLFVVNSANEILMQQRSKLKFTFPEFWSNTVCSHPFYSEKEREMKDFLGVRIAAQRRLREEFNIIHDDPGDFLVVGDFFYQAEFDSRYCESERILIR